MEGSVAVRYQKEQQTFNDVPLDMTVGAFVQERGEHVLFSDLGQRPSQEAYISERASECLA